MSHGLLDVLRIFFLILIWLFFVYAARMVIVEVRRSRVEAASEDPQQHSENRALKLRVVDPPDQRGRTYDLGGDVTLGRSAACVVPLEGDTFASSVHARVFTRSGELWLEDLGSTNGTFCNDRRIAAPVRIRRGDRLKIGRTVMEVAR